ncbi:50S ribosomal protein L18 [Candidatus Vidania fulgoroideorum]
MKKGISNKTNILSVHKTNKHIYLQIHSLDKKYVLLSCSSNDKEISKYTYKKKIKSNCKKTIKKIVDLIVIKANKVNIKNIIFFSKYPFKGKIKIIFEYIEKKNFIYHDKKSNICKKDNICSRRRKTF